MTYSIGQVAKKLGLTTHTLRYYDKEGLLPSVHKSSSGLRVFTEKDLEWLIIIECLKGCGMSLKDIKHYIDMCMQGDETILERLEMFKKQKEHLVLQMQQLKEYMEKIDYKIAYYTEAAKRGSIDAVQYNKCLMKEKERIFGQTIKNLTEDDDN